MGKSRAQYSIFEWVDKSINGQKIIKKSKSLNGFSRWVIQCGCGYQRDVCVSSFMKGKQQRCISCQIKGQTGPKHPHWRGGTHVPMTHFSKFKKSALKRKIEWSIQIKDIDDLYEKQKGICALSEEPLCFDHGGNTKIGLGNASLDRIDSDKGYIKSNIQLVTKDCNMAKQKLSNEKFKMMCMAVVNACL